MSLRPKNQVSREEAKKLHDDSKLTWRKWERRIEAMLRAGRWRFLHLPRLPTKELNKRLPKDWPDFLAVGKRGGPNHGRFIWIEAKTGSATPTDGQEEMISLLKAARVPGGVFYPAQSRELGKFLKAEGYY